jgi:hypothetical protein
MTPRDWPLAVSNWQLAVSHDTVSLRIGKPLNRQMLIANCQLLARMQVIP